MWVVVAMVAGVVAEVGGHQTLSKVPMLSLTVLQAFLLAGEWAETLCKIP